MIRNLLKARITAMTALAFVANVAFGQSFRITSNGTEVSNNSVIEVKCEVDDSFKELWGETSYSWDPKLEASAIDGEAFLSVTVAAGENTNNVQFCWPTQCWVIAPGSSKTCEGVVEATPSDLSIHRSITATSDNDVPTEDGELKVKIEGETETMEFTVKFLAPDNTGISEILGDSNVVPEFYTVDGIKVDNLEKGLYIVKVGTKSKLIYVR